MLSTNAPRASVTRPCCSCSSPSSSASVSRRPTARRVAFRKTIAPRTEIKSPSRICSNSGAPGASMSVTPLLTSSSGPGFGKRPETDGATLTTTRTPDSTSSSAETRSSSAWSMIAMSSGPSRVTSRFVRLSRRAGPLNSSVVLIGLRKGTRRLRAYARSRRAAHPRRAARCACGSGRPAPSRRGNGGRRRSRSAAGG